MVQETGCNREHTRNEQSSKSQPVLGFISIIQIQQTSLVCFLSFFLFYYYFKIVAHLSGINCSWFTALYQLPKRAINLQLNHFCGCIQHLRLAKASFRPVLVVLKTNAELCLLEAAYLPLICLVKIVATCYGLTAPPSRLVRAVVFFFFFLLHILAHSLFSLTISNSSA